MSAIPDHGGQAIPSSAEVLRDLRTFRAREGISPGRIQKAAKAVTRLRVVSDQLVRCGLNPEDRHIAAYQAIECVITNLVDNAMFQTILLVSLNYKSKRREMNCQPPFPVGSPSSKQDLLGDRRDRLMAMYYWSKEETYKAHQDQAYEELANLLVQATISPCLQESARVAAHYAEGVAVAAVLSLLSIEHRKLAQDILTSGILDKYPKLMSLAQFLPEVGRAQFVVSFILRAERFQKYMRRLKKRLELGQTLVFTRGELLEEVLFENSVGGAPIDESSVAWPIRDEDLIRPELLERRGELNRSELVSVIENSIDALVEYMNSAEQGSTWGLIVGARWGSGDGKVIESLRVRRGKRKNSLEPDQLAAQQAEPQDPTDSTEEAFGEAPDASKVGRDTWRTDRT